MPKPVQRRCLAPPPPSPRVPAPPGQPEASRRELTILEQDFRELAPAPCTPLRATDPRSSVTRPRQRPDRAVAGLSLLLTVPVSLPVRMPGYCCWVRLGSWVFPRLAPWPGG